MRYSTKKSLDFIPIFISGVSLIFLSCLTGCVTGSPGKNRVAEVLYQPAGYCVVDSARVRLPDLSKTLQRKGYSRKNTIEIHIPKNTGQEELKNISNELVAGGFSRFIFVGQRKAISFTE